MATSAAPKTEKVKKTPASLSVRIKQQLDRAVLARKISKEELQTLATHIAKLDAFLD